MVVKNLNQKKKTKDKKKGKLLKLPASKTSKKIRLKIIKLGWTILEHKFRYYKGSEYKIKPVADVVYDEVEDEYKKLCKKYGMEPSASDMVEFDESRPSCRLVMEHMIATKGKGNSQEVRKKVNEYKQAIKEVLEELDVDEKLAKKIRIKIKKRFAV